MQVQILGVTHVTGSQIIIQDSTTIFFRIISFVAEIIIIICATNKNYSGTKKNRNKFASKKFDYIYELVCWIDLGRLVFHFEIG